MVLKKTADNFQNAVFDFNEDADFNLVYLRRRYTADRNLLRGKYVNQHY